MSKLDFIYYKLCLKYGEDSIFMKKKIVHWHDMYPNKDNVWESQQELGVNLGPIEFYKLDDKKELIKIDLKKEQENGTFEN